MRAASLAVLLALLAGLPLRLVGIDHGAPDLIFHPDVSKQVHVAIRAFQGEPEIVSYEEEDFERRLYPYGTAVLLGTALRMGERAGLFHVDRGDTPERQRWLWSLRLSLLSAALYPATVALLILLLAKVLPPPVLALTGILLVVEPAVVRFSHYGMNDVPLLCVLLLAWAGARGMEAEGRAGLLMAGVTGFLLGVGFGVKYQALLGLLFPAVAWLRLRGAGRLRRVALSASLLGAAFLAGVAVSSPVFREDPLGFPGQFALFMDWQANIMGGDAPPSGKIARNLLWLARFSLHSGLAVLLPGAAWAGARALRRDGAALLPPAASGLCFTAALLVLLVTTRDLMRESDVMYVFPFLVILTGYAAGGGGKASGAKRLPPLVLRAAMAALAVAWGITAARDSLAFSRPDTRVLARRWCREHIPPGSRVLSDRYSLPVEADGVGEWSFHSLLRPPASKLIQRRRFEYLVTTSLAQERYFDELSPFLSERKQRNFERFLEIHPVLAVFEDRRLPFNHPRVTIYGKSPQREKAEDGSPQGSVQR